MRNSLTCITAQDPSLCSRMTRGFRVCAKSIIAGSRGSRCGRGSPSRVVRKLSFVGTDVPTRLVYERCQSSRAATHMMLVRKILLVTSHKISTIAHSFRASHINARGFWGYIQPHDYTQTKKFLKIKLLEVAFCSTDEKMSVGNLFT